MDNIRQAGLNLLSIINDILDFSKIESGKMDLTSAEYQFASIINDVIAIIRMRLHEKPIRFVTMIDGSLPAVLEGDEVRVRQILLNLLTNAVKYTNEGSIVLSVSRRESPEEAAKTYSDGEEPKIVLAFGVADTGIGIKKEDMEKLFGEFTQFDRQQNRGVEGTGLGLVISRNFCILMGGDITVASDYGRGSVFTAIIPQIVRDSAPIAVVERPETKNVLIYDDRSLYADSLAYTMESMGVSCARALSKDNFTALLEGRQFIFVSPSLLDEAREILLNRSGFSGADAEPALILLTDDWQAGRSDVQTVSMPLQPLALANVLNGQKSDTERHEGEHSQVRFIAPEARALIVDDIDINLDVVQGLLSPYEMTIDRASGGREAVRMAQENQYDLVFMDHMMPDMDGIEATAAIRAWEEKSLPQMFLLKTRLPIVALTANAISGMKEMFFEKGFSDYLSKPIEIAKLDEVMARWIPAEKRIKAGVEKKRTTFSGESSLHIPGVDVKRGINMTGGTEAGYRKVLAQFYKDALERLDGIKAFAAIIADGNVIGDRSDSAGPDPGEDVFAFSARVHAIKSAAGTIGAEAVSEKAAALEAAGKAGDIKAIHESLSGFCEDLTELLQGIRAALEEALEEKKGGPANGAGKKAMAETLSALRVALETKNMKETDRLLADLEQAAADAVTTERIMDISDKVLVGEYEEAVKSINILYNDKER
jgi:CheY-like chemotaxis protein